MLLLVELRDARKLSVLETVRGLLQVPVVAAHLEYYLEALLQRSQARQKAIALVESSNANAREPA